MANVQTDFVCCFFFVFVSVHSVSVIFNAALYASPLAGVWSAFLEFMSHRERW